MQPILTTPPTSMRISSVELAQILSEYYGRKIKSCRIINDNSDWAKTGTNDLGHFVPDKFTWLVMITKDE